MRKAKSIANSYPDDYAGDRLFLCCASVDHAMALYDAAGEVVAKVLGETIKPRIFHPLSVVIAARAALAADGQTAAAP